MAMSGDDALVLAKSYAKKTVQGMGAIKGQDGFSPAVTENAGNTPDVYKLDVTNKSGSFTTPNLKGEPGRDGVVKETDFNRLEWDARRKVDNLTLGRLKFAFPTDEDAIESVRRCVCKVINIAWQIEAAEKRITDAQGYEVNQDGSMRGKIVSSISSGSESVSYTAKSEGSTMIDTVLTDKTAQDRLYRDAIKEYLSMVPDSNGVNLMYSGIPYPVRNAPISKPPETKPEGSEQA